MKTLPYDNDGFHHKAEITQVAPMGWYDRYVYTFDTCFHPFVSDLVARLSTQTSVAEMLDPSFLEGLYIDSFKSEYTTLPQIDVGYNPKPKTIDIGNGPYANYNWELFYHIPVAVAVHLSKTQHFAEAQKWFHYVFDPTTTDTTDIKENPIKRYWRFLGFRQGFGLQLMPSLQDVSGMPTDGESLIIVADVQNATPLPHLRCSRQEGRGH